MAQHRKSLTDRMIQAYQQKLKDETGERRRAAAELGRITEREHRQQVAATRRARAHAAATDAEPGAVYMEFAADTAAESPHTGLGAETEYAELEAEYEEHETGTVHAAAAMALAVKDDQDRRRAQDRELAQQLQQQERDREQNPEQDQERAQRQKHEPEPVPEPEPVRAREQDRAARQAERDARLAQSDQAKDEAWARTERVREIVAGFGRLLSERERALEHYRLAVLSAFATGDEDAVGSVLTAILFDLLGYAEGGTETVEVTYCPGGHGLEVRIDLPKRTVVPVASGYRYVTAMREIVADQRREADRARIYRDLTARFTLLAFDYAFGTCPPSLVDAITLHGSVHSKDPATGAWAHTRLIHVRVERAQFELLVLDAPELDPGLCLRRFNATVTAHPYETEELVTP